VPQHLKPVIDAVVHLELDARRLQLNAGKEIRVGLRQRGMALLRVSARGYGYGVGAVSLVTFRNAVAADGRVAGFRRSWVVAVAACVAPTGRIDAAAQRS